MTDRFGATSSDAELISAARSGDDGAYRLLCERHAGAARRLARLIVHRADVDNVVAETFAEVLGAMRRGVGPYEAFRPYLLTVVRRVGHDHAHAAPTRSH